VIEHAQFTEEGVLVWRNGTDMPNLTTYCNPTTLVPTVALMIISEDQATTNFALEKLNGQTHDFLTSSLDVQRNAASRPTQFEWSKGNASSRFVVRGQRTGDSWTVTTFRPNGAPVSTMMLTPSRFASQSKAPEVNYGDKVLIAGKQVHTVAWAPDMPTGAELDARAEQRGHFALYGSILGGAVFIGLGTILLRRR